MLKYIYQKLARLGIPKAMVPARTHELVENDNGKEIKVAVGDAINVKMLWKPSTGFIWQESGTTIGPLEEIRHEGEPDVPGSPVMIHFRFRVRNSGHITLSYARPWSELNPPAKWFYVQVKINL